MCAQGCATPLRTTPGLGRTMIFSVKYSRLFFLFPWFFMARARARLRCTTTPQDTLEKCIILDEESDFEAKIHQLRRPGTKKKKTLLSNINTREFNSRELFLFWVGARNPPQGLGQKLVGVFPLILLDLSKTSRISPNLRKPNNERLKSTASKQSTTTIRT